MFRFTQVLAVVTIVMGSALISSSARADAYCDVYCNDGWASPGIIISGSSGQCFTLLANLCSGHGGGWSRYSRILEINEAE